MGHNASKLFKAASDGNLDTLRRMIEAGAPVNARDKTQQNYSLLMFASLHGTARCSHLLVDTTQTNESNESTTEAVDTTCELAGHYDACVYLVEHKADVNLKSYKGATSLHNACLFTSENVVKVHSQCSISQRSGSLADAVIAKLLLEHGAQVNHTDKYGETPLHTAARSLPSMRVLEALDVTSLLDTDSASCRIVNMLLAYGADPTMRNVRVRE